MERTEWLKQMRDKAEKLYDHFSPLYWVKYGRSAGETHLEYLRKLLDRVPAHSTLLSAGCGAGLYDRLLLEAGHSVLGIDQSEGMLARARERFPEVRYEKMGLQEIDFPEAFGGAICIDALEHICPEDWPAILSRFREALKPGGVFYLTVDRGGDFVEEAYEQVMVLEPSMIPDKLSDSAVYHYHPSLDQVRTWLRQAGLAIEKEGAGIGFEDWYGYQHFVVSKGQSTELQSRMGDRGRGQ
jgi:SAM-dependent methyltransferase